MKNKLLTIVSIAALSVGINSAQAADFNYNYVEGSLQDIDINGIDSESATISGSFDITSNINLIGGYSAEQISTPAGFSDIDADTLKLGLGYHAPVGDNTDLTASFTAIRIDMDFVDSDTGYGIGIGLRHQINDVIEIGARADYVDIYEADDTTLEINSRFAVSDSVSLGLTYSTSTEEVDILSAGVRFDF